MARLSELRDLSKAHEAGLTIEEREIKEAEKAEAFDRLTREAERLVAPFRGMDVALDPTRGIRSALAGTREAMESIALASKPLASFAEEWATSPANRAMQAVQESAQKMFSALPRVDLPSFSVPNLSAIDRLTSLTRDLDLGRRGAWELSPPIAMPPRPAEDRDQDKRVDKITTVVVAQTSEIVELRAEVQRVRESAAQDAERALKDTQVRENRTLRISVLVAVLTAALSSILGALVTYWLSR